MTRLLTPAELAAATTDLPDWHIDSDAMHRTVEYPDFPAAIRAVVVVAEAAEAMNHHPDIDIRWRRVGYLLTTHDVGGISDLDLRLAQVIDRTPSP